jgi:excisionase family DNA binding protein
VLTLEVVDRDIIAEAVGPLPFPSFWRIDELGRLLMVEPAEIKRMIRAHEIPAFWVGGEYRILTKDLMTWLLLQRSHGGKHDERARRPRTGQA